MMGKVDIEPYMEKPPLGLKPRKIWLLERYREIKEAMKRYIEAEYEVPQAWIVELVEIEEALEEEDSRC